MKESSTIGETIRALRMARGMTQAQFAGVFGVGQTAVSAWEVGDIIPPADVYIRLAGLAPYPDNLWFLEQAGIEIEAIVSTTAKILKDRGASPEPGEIIRLPRFRLTAEGREQAGPPLVIAAERVPNPLSAQCLVLDEKTAKLVFSSGDIVVLDISAESATDLRPFWDQVVLMEFSPGLERNRGIRQTWPEGLLMGLLRLQKVYYTGAMPCWEAWLGPLMPPKRISFADGLLVGSWRYEYPPEVKFELDVPKDPRDWERAYKEAETQAPEAVRLLSGCRILGRMICWFRAASEKK